MRRFGENFVSLAVLLALVGCCERPQAVAAPEDRSPDPLCQPLMPIPGTQPYDDGYLTLLAQKLLQNAGGDDLLHMLLADMGREWAVQVYRDDDGSYRVVSRRVVEPVFATTSDYRDLSVAVEMWQASLPPDVFTHLNELWSAFLFGMRVPHSFNSFDRPHYYFGGRAGSLAMTGYADGPKDGTCIAQLRDIGELLFALPTLNATDRSAQLARLRSQVKKLRQRLEHARSP